VFFAAVATAWATATPAAEMSDEELIQNAISAAPKAVGEKAAVVNWD
jgi:hypothetical protein